MAKQQYILTDGMHSRCFCSMIAAGVPTPANIAIAAVRKYVSETISSPVLKSG